MHLLYWSKRAVIGCLALWGVLVTIYLVLGAVRHAALPPPYNLLIMLVLSTATAGAGAAWFAGRLEARSDHAVEAQDARDGRLYFEVARLRGEVGQLRELIDSTIELPRARMALVPSTAVAGVAPEVLDLSRKIHRKMIEGDPA